MAGKDLRGGVGPGAVEAVWRGSGGVSEVWEGGRGSGTNSRPAWVGGGPCGLKSTQEPKSTSLTCRTKGWDPSATNSQEVPERDRLTCSESSARVIFSSFKSRCRIPTCASPHTASTICRKMCRAVRSSKFRRRSTASNRSEEVRRRSGGGRGGRSEGEGQAAAAAAAAARSAVGGAVGARSR